MVIVTEHTELNKTLIIAKGSGKEYSLARTDQNSLTLPSQPRIQLQHPSELLNYVREEQTVRDLDKAAGWLWLLATPYHGHISPLHHQAARGRSLVVVENPHLHLVWYYDRIFIKPIPPYLLSHAFWQYLEYADQDLLRTAAGFLRTYAYLIQYESDFKKAQSSELRLIPKDDGEKEITFERFATFIATFAKVDDAQVTPRYHYGELRLSRLNLWAPVLFGKLTFHHINAQWSVFLTKFFAFALAAFLVLTTILNAMQVELAIQSISNTSDSWNVFAQVSRWFSVLVLLAVLAVILVFFGIVLFMFAHDLWFAKQMLWKKSRQNREAAMFKSGVV